MIRFVLSKHVGGLSPIIEMADFVLHIYRMKTNAGYKAANRMHYRRYQHASCIAHCINNLKLALVVTAPCSPTDAKFDDVMRLQLERPSHWHGNQHQFSGTPPSSIIGKHAMLKL
jgi:hypothetical protein